MFRIKMLCYDYGNPTPYEDTLAFDPKFDTVEKALDYARQCAEDEAEGLNEDCDELILFGTVEEKEKIIVNAYILEDELDTTGETEVVTIYYIEEV